MYYNIGISVSYYTIGDNLITLSGVITLSVIITLSVVTSHVVFRYVVLSFDFQKKSVASHHSAFLSVCACVGSIA